MNVQAAVAVCSAALALALGALLWTRSDWDDANRKLIKVCMQVSAAISGIFLGFFFSYPSGVVRRGVLTEPDDPVQLVIKDYYAATSPPFFVADASQDGPRKIKVSFEVTPPGASAPMDPFARLGERARWLELSGGRIFDRAVQEAGPAFISFVHVDTPEKLDDFLHPPRDALNDRLARFRYVDKNGKARVYEWIVDKNQVDKPFALPDSDMTVKLVRTIDVPLGGLLEHLGHAAAEGGDELMHGIQFKVRKGEGAEVDEIALASLPNFGPAESEEGKTTRRPVRVSYYHPPDISPTPMAGRKAGVIEVLVTDTGALYYRAFNRQGLRGLGPLTVGKNIDVFGGEGSKSPMKAVFKVEEYHAKGQLKRTYEPVEMPKGQADSGFPACLVEMRAGGESREFWLRRDGDMDMRWDDVEETIDLGSRRFKAWFDFARRPLGLDLTLVDFDLGTDPGTKEPSSYTSEVVVNDLAKDLRDKRVTITMNEPLEYGDATYYQIGYRDRDRLGRKTGDMRTVLQVGINPWWCWGMKYLGCCTVVLGTFVQFYMRAGVFTDGGKKERARAAAKELRKSGAKRSPVTSAIAAEDLAPDLEVL
jgi:hypothetical protein